MEGNQSDDKNVALKQMIQTKLREKKNILCYRNRSPNILDSETQCLDDLPSPTKLHRPSSPSILSVPADIKRRKELKDNAVKKSICSECALYGEGEDKRNEFFGKLVAEEFKYIKPCLRTKCYEQMLKYLQEAKGYHVNQLTNEEYDN